MYVITCGNRSCIRVLNQNFTMALLFIVRCLKMLPAAIFKSCILYWLASAAILYHVEVFSVLWNVWSIICIKKQHLNKISKCAKKSKYFIVKFLFIWLYCLGLKLGIFILKSLFWSHQLILFSITKGCLYHNFFSSLICMKYLWLDVEQVTINYSYNFD